MYIYTHNTHTTHTHMIPAPGLKDASVEPSAPHLILLQHA